MARTKDPSLVGKTEQINTRVSPETREALERARKDSGISLSREIEERLVRSINADGARDSGREETDALLSAIRIIIKNVEELTGQQWQADGFTRDAIASAVASVVNRLGPDSAPPPATFPTTFKWMWEQLRQEKTDQALAFEVGRFCADTTVQAMTSPRPARDHPIADYWSATRADERITSRGLAGLIRPPVGAEGDGNDD